MNGVPLLIVDGDNIAHRAFHSSPKSLVGLDGLPLNAIVGFVDRVILMWKRVQPRAVFVAWDTLGSPTYRDALWPKYQSGRDISDSIRSQLNVLPTICKAFNFGWGKQAGYEADDIIASAVEREVANGGSCLIVTTDRDAYQLVSDSVNVLCPGRGPLEFDRIGIHEVVAKFGVLPEQVADFKALSGDSSDKIPGIPGIGPQGAAALLLKYGDLETILSTWTDSALVEDARMFKKVVTVRCDFPAELPQTGPPDWQTGAAALKYLGAHAAADRIAKMGTTA